MSGGHSHSHAGTSPAGERRLWLALALTAGFLAVEVVASILTGSLALLSDAGHMATDAASLSIALLAIKLGRRPADERRSFGYRRLEILAAALNAAALFLIAAYVLVEAVLRLRRPEAIDAGGMIVVAALGLAVNAIAMVLLRERRNESLNLRSAYLEVWADMLGSAAVLAGGFLIVRTGAAWIDPVVAILIALWVLPRGWRLLRDALHVLLEGTPEGIDPGAVERTILSVDGVSAVHDLHIWCITTGMPMLSAHLHVDSMGRWDAVLAGVQQSLARDHHIAHVTLQPELDGSCKLQAGCP
jgi:cobalt-zinc-cadmium efflux system protein